ncbi:DUF397 domain-containing protein [Streptomyces sp. NPDC058662]|uniref:DUF397 domain-containing protein n=1 Tax=Streptomyces sp. NPDC058662 TaxID=3346583 RepID=UPI00364C1039
MTEQASLSAGDLGDVEWRKSSYSGGGESQCIEVADLSTTGYNKIAVRDSKRPAGLVLMLSASAYTTFINIAAAGEV